MRGDMGNKEKEEDRQRVSRILTGLWAFLSDPRYSTVATWLQTVILAVTLVYAGAQVSQLIEQNRGFKREKFYGFLAEYNDHLASRIELVRRLAWRSRLPEVTTEQFKNEMSGADVKGTIDEYLRFVYRLDTCVTSEVCDKEKTSEFLCADVERTYLALNHDLERTHQHDWEALQVWGHEIFFSQMIDNHCGFFNRTYF